MTIAVINLGVGNTASVMFALDRLGVSARLTSSASEIIEAERIILPGVGAAAHAMKKIDEAGVRAALINTKRPLLGICLGQQILFEWSEEGGAPCLGVLPGSAMKLQGGNNLPVPHVGWAKIGMEKENPLFDGVKSGDYCYFAHSYACGVDDNAIATATYGAVFAAAVARGNFYGCQFHPERSGEVGRLILSNFLALPC